MREYLLTAYSWASVPGHGNDIVFKLLSVCPESYPDAPAEGVRRILETATGTNIPRGQPLDLSLVESIRMGTTVATK
jgi:5-oxoprolinase (ATP-hydrolysing)